MGRDFVNRGDQRRGRIQPQPPAPSPQSRRRRVAARPPGWPSQSFGLNVGERWHHHRRHQFKPPWRCSPPEPASPATGSACLRPAAAPAASGFPADRRRILRQGREQGDGQHRPASPLSGPAASMWRAGCSAADLFTADARRAAPCHRSRASSCSTAAQHDVAHKGGQGGAAGSGAVSASKPVRRHCRRGAGRLEQGNASAAAAASSPAPGLKGRRCVRAAWSRQGQRSGLRRQQRRTGGPRPSTGGSCAAVPLLQRIQAFAIASRTGRESHSGVPRPSTSSTSRCRARRR